MRVPAPRGPAGSGEGPRPTAPGTRSGQPRSRVPAARSVAVRCRIRSPSRLLRPPGPDLRPQTWPPRPRPAPPWGGPGRGVGARQSPRSKPEPAGAAGAAGPCGSWARGCGRAEPRPGGGVWGRASPGRVAGLRALLGRRRNALRIRATAKQSAQHTGERSEEPGLGDVKNQASLIGRPCALCGVRVAFRGDRAGHAGRK